VGVGDKVVNKADKSTDKSLESLGVGGSGGNSKLKGDALARSVIGEPKIVSCCSSFRHRKKNILGGPLLGHVGNNKVLQKVAALGDDVLKLLVETHISNLLALSHNGGPVGESLPVAGAGQGKVVALLSVLLHATLVDNGPNKVVVLGASRGNLGGLSTVEGSNGHGNGVGRLGHSIEEEGENNLGHPGNGIVTSLELDSGVHELDVLSSGGVRNKFHLGVLLDSSIGVEGVLVESVGLSLLRETDKRELLGKDRGDCSNESSGDATVAAGSPHVDSNNKHDQKNNVALGLEFAEGVTLPYGVPRAIETGGSA
jgi:hypothetical protein